MQRMNAGAIGLVVVVLALLVTAPRLAHAFIMADGLAMDATWEYWLLVVTGVASGLVLTLGNAYLAHVLASHFTRDDALSWVLLSAWCVYLVFAVALIAPALVVGLVRSPLTAVLWWPLVWVYAVVAALSVEVLVAGSMAGYAIARKEAHNATALSDRVDVAPTTDAQDARTNATPGVDATQTAEAQPAAGAPAPHDAIDAALGVRIVAGAMQTEPAAVRVAPNGNGHHAQEDAPNVCKRCGQAYEKGNAGSHWTWDCTANPDRRKRKGE